MRVVLLIATLMPAPAAALEYCADLWFTRNLVFHRAGYCFGSVLGEAVFGNAACTGKDVRLDKTAADLVARVQAREKEAGCRVDTARTSLPVALQAQRRGLTDLPVATEFESACVNWLHPPLPLYAAKSTGAPVSASVVMGDTLLFEFEDEGPWRFGEVVRDGAIVSAGWTDDPLDASNCDMWAG